MRPTALYCRQRAYLVVSFDSAQISFVSGSFDSFNLVSRFASSSGTDPCQHRFPFPPSFSSAQPPGPTILLGSSAGHPGMFVIDCEAGSPSKFRNRAQMKSCWGEGISFWAKRFVCLRLCLCVAMFARHCAPILVARFIPHPAAGPRRPPPPRRHVVMRKPRTR